MRAKAEITISELKIGKLDLQIKSTFKANVPHDRNSSKLSVMKHIFDVSGGVTFIFFKFVIPKKYLAVVFSFYG